MDGIGERLLKYRKTINLSQEDVAEKLNVSRQTISKWETNQSIPDLDKIVPLCDLFNITADELLTGKVSEKVIKDNPIQRAIVISLSVFLYFMSLIWIIVGESVLNLSEGILVGVFFGICAVATCMLIFYFVSKGSKEEKEEEHSLEKSVINLLTLIAVIVYFALSFITMAWHITWIIWLIYATLVCLIKILFDLKEGKYDK